MSVTGIVLAGGRASRLGGAKLDLRIGDRSLLQLAIDAVASVATEVVVAGPPTWGLAAGTLPLRFVEDRHDFPGPLVALAGALESTASDRAIAVAGDMPFLAPAVLRLLLDRLATKRKAAAVLLAAPHGGKRQVLPMALRVGSARERAGAALAAGDRSLTRLLDRLEAVEIPAAEWLALDPAGRTLVDIDDPADLERWGASGLREVR